MAPKRRLSRLYFIAMTISYELNWRGDYYIRDPRRSLGLESNWDAATPLSFISIDVNFPQFCALAMALKCTFLRIL